VGGYPVTPCLVARGLSYPPRPVRPGREE
jgi:hypothetical protein